MNSSTQAIEPERASEDVSGRAASTPVAATSGTFGRQMERFALVGVLVMVVAVFSILRPDTFFSLATLQNVLGSQTVLLILALGLIAPLTANDFDLSVAGNMSLAAMTVAVLSVKHDFDLGVAILVALAISVVIGLVNAFFVVWIGVNSLIVTLGSGTVLLGIVQWVSASRSVTGIDSILTQATIGQRFAGMPLTFYYGLVLTLILWFVLEYTPIGRRLLFVGRGPSVARLTGLNVPRIRWGSFVFCALTAGVAGVIYAGTLGAADPSSGNSFLLPAFAAVFLGSTAISPGRFNPFGTFIAVFFLATGIIGLQLLGADNYVQHLFYGGALVIAVSLSTLIRRRTTAALS